MSDKPEQTKTKTFVGSSEQAARAEANKWVGNFLEHGPVYVHTIEVVQRGGNWEATVTYTG